jgi:sialate O-acetylesterase
MWVCASQYALAETYKKNIPAPAYLNPKYKSMEVSKGKVNLYFDSAPNGFMVKGDSTVTEFVIAEMIKTFYPQK